MPSAPLAHTVKPPTLAWLVLGCIALSALHTKTAGLAWLLWLIWAWHTWRHRNPASATHPHPALKQAAQAWLIGVLLYAAVELGMAWGWYGACCDINNELNSHVRLSLAAVATLVLVRHLRPWPDMRHHINLALVSAAFSGAVLATVVDRFSLPSHPIPWAGFMAFLACLLLPQAWDSTTSNPRRWLYGVAASFAMLAVVLSQSRGVLVVLILPVLLALFHGLRGHRRLLLKTGLAALTLVATLTTLSLTPADPLRLRQAANETQAALQTQNYNSSLGARVYLAQLAWHHFNTSPWTGVGAQERSRLLKQTPPNQTPEQAESLSHVATLGHVHNQYLHHAFDHGLVGLLGLFAFLLLMLWTSLRLLQIHHVAGLQFGYVFLIHIFVSASNVNLAHNYYSLGLALATGLIFLQSLATPSNHHTG